MMRYLFGLWMLAFFSTLNAQNIDASGKRQGYWKKLDEKTNKPIYEGEFKDDKPTGIFKYYYPNDSLRAIMVFKNMGTVAYAKLFHPNGKRMAEGKYVNKEIKDSTWVYYDELGILISRETYAMGKKDGTSFVYYPEGLVSEERNYKNDVQEGPFKQYFDGKKIKAQGNYIKGKLEGRLVYLFPNGVEAAAGFYVNGNKNGPWIYKNQDGTISERELFKNGKQASKKETDEFFAKSKNNKPKTEDKKTETKTTNKPANKVSTTKGKGQ